MPLAENDVKIIVRKFKNSSPENWRENLFYSLKFRGRLARAMLIFLRVLKPVLRNLPGFFIQIGGSAAWRIEWE